MIVAAVRLAGACAGAAIAELEAATTAAGASLRVADGAAGLAGAQVICVVGGPEAVLADELVRALRKTRAPVLGICGGAGALVRGGLLDAAIVDAPGGAVDCMVEGRATPFTAALPAGRSRVWATPTWASRSASSWKGGAGSCCAGARRWGAGRGWAWGVG
jgi:putative intracellular protease/amidase